MYGHLQNEIRPAYQYWYIFTVAFCRRRWFEPRYDGASMAKKGIVVVTVIIDLISSDFFPILN